MSMISLWCFQMLDWKSRLLRETISQASQNGYEGCWIDLKHISEKETVEEAIQKLSEQGEQSSIFYSSTNFDFKKDEENLIFCLDSLDEVGVSEQFNIIKKVSAFRLDFPKAKILLSCRTDIFQQFKHLFQDISNLKKLEIKPLDFVKVRRFIEAVLPDKVADWTQR